MKRWVAIFDTDYLLVYLDVTGFERAGPDEFPVTHEDAVMQVAELKEQGALAVLPYAVIVEAGNHICIARHSVRRHASSFVELIRQMLAGDSFWIPFDDTPGGDLKTQLTEIAERWPGEPERGVSLGDYAVRQVANF